MQAIRILTIVTLVAMLSLLLVTSFTLAGPADGHGGTAAAAIASDACTYYVATDGSDSDPGTEAQPSRCTH